MLKSHLKIVFSYLIIGLFISSFAHGNDKNKVKNNEHQAFFIIDYNVNLYNDKDSFTPLKKMTFFDQIIVLSNDITANKRIKIKLEDGSEGWVEEKYTSYVPTNWKKLLFAENYYCYAYTDKKINFQRKDGEYNKGYYYLSSDFKVSMSIVFIKDYKQDFISKENIIEEEIESGHDKRFNWNKEFIIGNHKINYVITTDHPDGGISEMFNFVKLKEMNLKKYYYVTFDYQPYESKDKILMQRKILFSTLQSLK